MNKPQLTDFLSLMAEQFDEAAALLQPDTQFRTLESWSSLQSLIVVTAIDEAYGVTLRENQLSAANTLEELFLLTLNHMG